MITAEPTAALDLRAPRTLEEAGLSRDLITQLVLKTLHFSGELSGTELSRRLGLPFMALEPVVTVIKQQHQVEISGGALGAPSYHYRITDIGRSRAMLFLEQSHYVGCAPVPLAAVPRIHGGVPRRRSRTRSTARRCATRSRIWSSASGCSINSGPP